MWGILWEISDSDEEIVEILAPLTNLDNFNSQDEDGETPIMKAAYHGYTEIVKILVPLTDNPNVPDKLGRTPFDICGQSLTKNDEIRTILKSFKLSKKRTEAEPPKPQPTKRPRKQ